MRRCSPGGSPVSGVTESKIHSREWTGGLLNVDRPYILAQMYRTVKQKGVPTASGFPSGLSASGHLVYHQRTLSDVCSHRSPIIEQV